MPILEQCFDVWSMDFISGIPGIQGYNTFFVCIDKFTKFVHLIPCFKGEGALIALECTNIFLSNIVRLFGVQKMVLHDGDSWFTPNLI